MRRRFELKDGVLVDRDGQVLGRLLSITLDVPAGSPFSEEKGGTTGGDEVLSPTASPGSSNVEEEPQRDGGVGEGPSDADRVWGKYVLVMEPRRIDLDPEARKIIREALKVASVAECELAIEGCKASPFHMGQNDRKRKYNKLAQILKARRGHNETTRDRIEFFMEIAARAGVQSHVSSAPYAKVQQAKREVLAGWEFPHDDVVVRRGEEAARWLRAQGFGISYAPDGRPSFLPPTVM